MPRGNPDNLRAAAQHKRAELERRRPRREP